MSDAPEDTLSKIERLEAELRFARWDNARLVESNKACGEQLAQARAERDRLANIEILNSRDVERLAELNEEVLHLRASLHVVDRDGGE